MPSKNENSSELHEKSYQFYNKTFVLMSYSHIVVYALHKYDIWEYEKRKKNGHPISFFCYYSSSVDEFIIFIQSTHSYLGYWYSSELDINVAHTNLLILFGSED